MQRRRRSWVIGGTALIVSGLPTMLWSSLLGTPALPVIAIVSDIAWAIGVLMLIVGIDPDDSLVARKPLGTVAGFVVALWPLTSTLLGFALDARSSFDSPAWNVLAYAGIVIPIAAGLVAAVQIARAGVAPHPWRWAPLWVLAGQAVVWTVPQLASAAVPDDAALWVGPVSALGILAILASTLGLGILAIVLAPRPRPDTVAVFPPAAS